MSDIAQLIKITFQIYKRVLITSAKQSLSHWRVIFFHFASLIAIGIFYAVMRSPDIVSSIIRGLFSSYFLALYLATIRGIIKRETFSPKYIFQEALDIFSPVISIYFFLMLVGFVLRAVNNSFVSIIFSIVFSVLANPILEVLYLRGSGAMAMINDSIEFVKDNFVEWFAPIIVIGILTMGLNPQVLLSLFSDSPLQRIELTLMFMSVVSLNVGMWFYVVPALYLLMFVMVSRGNLYLELEKGRRSRIYKARMGE